MALREQKGNMYSFVTHTWNAIKGKCEHGCSYCYMKDFPLKDVRLDESEFKTDLGEDNFIFVGSSCDMWARSIPREWIIKTIDHCNDFPNKYLFQSKYPLRFAEFRDYFPESLVLGTTIETNREYEQMGQAPKIPLRALSMSILAELGYKTMVTVEPVMDFDLEILAEAIKICKPQWVNIGADSKGHKLPEPSHANLHVLIRILREFTEVKLKDNLKRLMK